MPGSRIRSRVYATAAGGFYEPQSVGLTGFVDPDINVGFETTTDTYGLRQSDNVFNSVKSNRLLGYTGGDIGAWFCHQCYTVTGPPAHNLYVTSVPSDNEAVSKAIAITNPSAPHIDVPEFLGEMKDMPRMLKELGEANKTILDLARKGKKFSQRKLFETDFPYLFSKGFVSWEFGWKPLLSDLDKLLGFEKAASQRFDMIQKLAAGKGIQRNGTVWTEDVVSGPNDIYTPSQYGANLHFNFWVTTKWKRWVSVRWYPITPEALPQNAKAQRDLANKIVHGMDTVSADTAWNLLPWSWLIDYFTNIGDLLTGARNSLNLQHSNTCVMTHAETRVSRWERVPSVQTGVFTLNGEWGLDTKDRYPHAESPSYEASVPMLNLRQMSILSGLAIMRGR